MQFQGSDWWNLNIRSVLRCPVQDLRQAGYFLSVISTDSLIFFKKDLGLKRMHNLLLGVIFGCWIWSWLAANFMQYLPADSQICFSCRVLKSCLKRVMDYLQWLLDMLDPEFVSKISYSHLLSGYCCQVTSAGCKFLSRLKIHTTGLNGAIWTRGIGLLGQKWVHFQTMCPNFGEITP